MRQTDARAVALRLFLVLGFCWIFRSKELIYDPELAGHEKHARGNE